MSKFTLRYFRLALLFSVVLLKLVEGTPWIEQDEALTERIVNGISAEQGQFPWAMALLKYRIIQCTYSLISVETAIGAAHCIYQQTLGVFEGRIGDIRVSRGERVFFKKGFVHPKYNYTTKLNDVGLLIFQKPVVISDRVKPIPLPLVHRTYTGNAEVAGWGCLSNESMSCSDELRTAVVNIYRCRLSDLPPEQAATIICAGTKGKGTGRGDSGTALIYGQGSGRFAIGINIAGRRGSAIIGEPSFYISTGYCINWIKSTAVGAVTYIDPHE